MTVGFGKRATVATAIVVAVIAMVCRVGAFAQSFPVLSAIGTGTMSPGLPTSGCANQGTVTFDSAVLVYADPGTAPLAPGNIHFSGASSICETLNAGQGSGTLSGSLAGTVNYTRTANIETLSGTVNGGTIIAAVCIFTATSVNPATSYALACAGALSSPGGSLIPTVTPSPVPTPTVPAGPLPPCTTEAGVVACASLTPTTTQSTYAVDGVSSTTGPVAGYVDTYRFTLANGGIVTLPCVVLVSGSTTVDPCADAGGTYVATLQTLSTLSVAASTPIATVRVCNADLVLTVDGIGINSFPAFVLC